jgi:hypothetical protein
MARRDWVVGLVGSLLLLLDADPVFDFFWARGSL